MKKIITVTLLLSSVLLLTTSNVQAAESTNKLVDSKAIIQMRAGDDPVAPLDPDNPDEPDDKPGTGQDGSLQINYVSSLDFGKEVEITSGNIVAPLRNVDIPYFQVSDLRGTGTGWTLKAKLSNFVSTKDQSKTIKGAWLQYQHPKVRTNNQVETAPAVAPSKRILQAGQGFTTMMSASKGRGRGTWLLTFPKRDVKKNINESITFHAPSSSVDADTFYVAHITWDLFDGPTANDIAE